MQNSLRQFTHGNIFKKQQINVLKIDTLSSKIQQKMTEWSMKQFSSI